LALNVLWRYERISDFVTFCSRRVLLINNIIIRHKNEELQRLNVN